MISDLFLCFLVKKCWREYDLDKNGQKILTKKGNDYKSHKVYANDWDDRGNVEKWRVLWADIETDFYKRNGYEITAEHCSFERQGIALLPTIHMGAAVTAMERRGIQNEVVNVNREIKKINVLIISSMENVERLTDKMKYVIVTSGVQMVSLLFCGILTVTCGYSIANQSVSLYSVRAIMEKSVPAFIFLQKIGQHDGF